MSIKSREQQTLAEDTPLLGGNQNTTSPSTIPQRCENDLKAVFSRNIANRLYLSHFLSTWNSRVFEFGAVLYLATIYPGTLLPMSVYALSRGLAAIIFSPAVGHYIDVANRLRVVRFAIGELIYSFCHHPSHTDGDSLQLQFYKDLPWLRHVSSSTCSQSKYQ